MLNESGVNPVLERVLVKPDDIEEVTEGGIYIPDQVAERHEQAQATGIVVALGPDAYIDSREVISRLVDGSMRVVEIRESGPNREHTPKLGDRVVFAKYGGLEVMGEDGIKYRIMNDRDITAHAQTDVKYTGIQSRKPVGVKT